MQQQIDTFETFKVEAIPAPQMPSQPLVLPAPIMAVQDDQSEHRARYDAALDGTTTRGQRALLFLIVLLVLAGWALSLYLDWRLQ